MIFKSQKPTWLANSIPLAIVILLFTGAIQSIRDYSRTEDIKPSDVIQLRMFKAGSASQMEIDNGCICPLGLNVLYTGIPNPLNISIPGVSESRIKVEITNGTIEKDGSSYNVTVPRPGSTTITASGGGKKYSMVFRTRNLPKPEARWGTIDNDGLPKPRVAVAAQSRVIASMGEGFAFEGVRYTITRYQFIFSPQRGETRVIRAAGAQITPSMQSLIREGSRGDRILVDQIRARGPSGERALSPIVIELI